MSPQNKKPAQSLRILDWLHPGLGIKRWIVLLLVGVTVLGVGLSFALVEIYTGGGYLPPLLNTLTLQFVPRYIGAVGLGVLGTSAISYALVRLTSGLVAPLVPAGRSMVKIVAERRRKNRGPKLVVIGGGTGMASLLRGIKYHTSNVTAIVTVADDGGSSGRLRRSLGILPPGDFRDCLAALADDEALITQLFRYRFGGDGELAGHSFGNLFILAMAEVSGSFESALLESSRVMNVKGRVMPSTLHDVTLCAEVRGSDNELAKQVSGESSIPETVGNIERVYLEPENVYAYPGAVQAVLAADMVVVGPGSLFTSILPSLLVSDLTAAIRSSQALKVYVCNVATQPGETDGFSVSDHVRALDSHTDGKLFEFVIANRCQKGSLLPDMSWTTLDLGQNSTPDIITADVVDDAYPWRHDSKKLALALLGLLGKEC